MLQYRIPILVSKVTKVQVPPLAEAIWEPPL